MLTPLLPKLNMARLNHSDLLALGFMTFALFLGAGNIMSIAPLDTLYELIAHNRVVALKLNPITDPLLPVFTKIFAPLIELGAVRVLTGGADVGGYLVTHDRVAHVHMTGSAKTHDAIVWGPGEEGERRRAEGTPLLTKPITSELGGVSPMIVVPGKWSDADIRYQAEHVVTQRIHNAGHNCIAGQSLILSSSWPQRSQFLDAIQANTDGAADAGYWFVITGTTVESGEEQWTP